MDIFKLRLVMLLFFLVCIGAYSQSRKIQFQNISVEDGISDNRVNTILQDKRGFLWLATRLGIDRYNGQSTKTYHLLKEHLEVNQLLQDVKGRIWAATTGGLYIFNQEKDQFEKWRSHDQGLNALLNFNIPCIQELDNGSFWCATASGAIVSISREGNKGGVIYQFATDKIRDGVNYATDLLLDKDCNIWMGTSQGDLLKYHDSKFTKEKFSASNNSSYINAIAMDRSRQLWIGTNGNGLFKFNVKNGNTAHYTRFEDSKRKGPAANIVLALMVDNEDNLWVGTDGGGLYSYSSKENEFVNFLYNRNSNFPLADNSILSLYQGDDNIIWAGTVHGGISYFRNNATLRQVSPSHLAFTKPDVQGSQILEATNGDIWLSAGRDGLRRYRPKTREVTVFKDHPEDGNDLSGNNVLSLFEDEQNRIWIGTLNGGLNIYDTLNHKFLKVAEGFGNQAIFAIQKDAEGNVWVGSNTGIRIYDPSLRLIKKYSVETTPNLCSNVITCLYKDITGAMWVGTSMGLNVFKKETLRTYYSIKNDPTTLSGNRIISITEDNNLSVLIGTYGFGLNRYNRTTDNFGRIGKEEGLEGNIIEGIFLDPNQDVWCSTNLGLSKIYPDGSIENYGVKDGVQAFHGGSAIMTRDGDIAMGGPFGLSFIKTADLKPESTLVPKIFFTSISILGRKGERNIPFWNQSHHKIVMDPEDNLLSVQYSNSDFWNRKKDKYVYKLKGLNNKWQAIGNQQLLTFSNLKPGSYSLQVSSVKNRGHDSAKIASVDIMVLPSFWQKAWVRTLSVLFIFTLVFLFFKWRVAAIKIRRKKLQMLVAIKTEEIKKRQHEVYQGRIALLKAEKENQNLNQNKLRDELHFKTEELTNYTLRTIHKNHLLNEIKSNLLEETKKGVSEKENLKKIINLINDSLTFDKDWENFYNLFDQIHPTFIKNLKNRCPELSDREIRLCVLIKLNFKSNHIATLFGISLSSVKVARHRLRKKLNVPENDSLPIFFDDLFSRICKCWPSLFFIILTPLGSKFPNSTTRFGKVRP